MISPLAKLHSQYLRYVILRSADEEISIMFKYIVCLVNMDSTFEENLQKC
jgi:hypothetical protein